ncbi:hypothetical protein [Agrococcus sp. ARC_14]|uniref:hypothetical protein n=1 Tax=Agrococcus sp. ARC_14 TaxID=2919927 RepID=UPI001F06485A|nr:hypothetical protein [Agrococcus sp. ARC_14]MCH1883653.1 hypothetical protein [Agrococcus sp. ARC_14]
MRGRAVAAIALVIAVGGCASATDGQIELTAEQAGDAYRSAICRIIETDGTLDAALASGDTDDIFEAARARAQLLSGRALTISEQHVWPAGAEAVWRVDEAFAAELSWVLEVADAPTATAARGIARPDLDARAALDREVRTALALPTEDAQLCS